MYDTPTVRQRWGVGEMSDVEALMALCHNHLHGCTQAFSVINEVVLFMREQEAKASI